MGTSELNRYTITNQFVERSIKDWASGFIEDRKAQGISQGTINIFYLYKLKLFFDFCDLNNVHSISQITAPFIHQYLLWLQLNHNPGECHAAYRALKTFLYWYEAENDLTGWNNLIKKVKAPKLPREILELANIEDIRALLFYAMNEIRPSFLSFWIRDCVPTSLFIFYF